MCFVHPDILATIHHQLPMIIGQADEKSIFLALKILYEQISITSEELEDIIIREPKLSHIVMKVLDGDD
jgi:hypothetical protein